jgi:hypothetical protein
MKAFLVLILTYLRCRASLSYSSHNRRIEAEDGLEGSRLFRPLKNGPHGELVERHARRLGGREVERKRGILTKELGKASIVGGRQPIQAGDRAALKRWLSVLCDESAIAPAVQPG